MVSWCNEWWRCTVSAPPGTGMALGPGGGARPWRDCKPALEPRSRAGLGDVWSGVPEGVLSSSELPRRDLFPFMEEVRGLWLLLFSLFSLQTQKSKAEDNWSTKVPRAEGVCPHKHNTQEHGLTHTLWSNINPVLVTSGTHHTGDHNMNHHTNYS